MSTVTILLSTYNGEKYIQKQLDSLFSQKFQDFMILVRDDGSSDTTLKILKKYQQKYGDKLRLHSDLYGNLGSAKSFMVLLENATSPYIMFCDQDDVWTDTKIELSLAKIKDMETAHGVEMPLLIFTDMYVVDNNLNILHESFWKYQKLFPEISFSWKKLLAQNVITGCTIIMNSNAKKVCLPFVLSMMMHDQWISVNVAKYGKIGFINIPTVFYRQHDLNVEGAHHYGWHYIILKLKKINEPLKKLYHFATYHNVSFILLLIRKMAINFKRLVKKS